MGARPALALQLLVTAIFAVLLTGALKEAPLTLPGLCQTVVVASSDEKFQMLSGLAAGFNAEGRFAGGRCVRVDVEEVNSGDAEQLLEDGWRGTSAPRPDVWSPASSAWVVLLQQRSASGARLIPAEYESLFQSPTVIAMPAPMAAAIGYPAKPAGWTDIFGLVENPAGWGSLGKPEWGRFKLAKTNPTISTSGLHALIGTYYAAGGAAAATVGSPSVRAFVGGIESAVVHYSPTAGAFLRDLRDADDHRSGLDYASAVVIEEQEMVRYNASSPAPRTPLVAVYPKEGTPVDDHPYVLLGWSTAAAGARAFYDYVAEQSRVVDASFFRDRFGEAGPRLASQQGISAALPVGRLTPPPGAVLQAMLDQWQTLRKRARVLVLVDAAAGRAASEAVSELGAAVKGFGPNDSAAVWVFPAPAEAPNPYIELRAMGPVDSGLERSLTGIQPVGGRPDLDRVIPLAVTAMTDSYSADAIDAILVVEMAPGQRAPADRELETILRNQPPDRFIRVFAVGPPSDRLRDLALAGRGAAYEPGGATHFLDDVIGNF